MFSRMFLFLLMDVQVDYTNYTYEKLYWVISYCVSVTFYILCSNKNAGFEMRLICKS